MWIIAAVLIGLAAPWDSRAEAEITSGDLKNSRTILEGDWLRLKLEVLAMRLSYPAYRIELNLDEENRIQFTFYASAALGENLAEMGKNESEEILAYHAEGIREQVTGLLRQGFAGLWSFYDAQEDVIGRFLVPGQDRRDPPRQLATWKGDRLYWNN